MQFHVYSSLLIISILFYFAQDVFGQVNDKLTNSAFDDILKKINNISMQTLSKATYRERLEILKKVEDKLSRAAETLGKKGERYVKLIMDGIKAKAFEGIANNRTSDTKVVITGRKSNENSINPKENYNIPINQHILEIAMQSDNETESKFRNTQESLVVNDTNKTKIYSPSDPENESILLKTQLRRVDADVNGNNVINDHANKIVLESSTERLFQSLTPRYECESLLDRTCMNIKQMKLLKCHFGDTDIPIEKLCDGFVDCPDRTDEKFCISQVTERVRNANEVFSEVDQVFALHCFPNDTKKSIMTTEIIIFRSVLQSQQEFVEKYRHLNWSLIPNNVSNKGEGTLKKTVNEISLIISTLAMGLDAVLCARRDETIPELNARKFSDLIGGDLDREIEEIEWPPKSCMCQNGICKNSTCSESCKRVCWQTYNLARWGCESINNTESVPISVICDGKYDCYDQSDEKDCVTGASFAKFETHEIFKRIFMSLSEKITSKEYASIRNMLLNLHDTLQNLQKFCMSSEPDIEMITKIRNRCFSFLTTIYLKVINKSTFPYETEDEFLFLMSLNENIVNALKHSNTGNKRIIANNRCYCRDQQCSMPICSRKCVRACIAEPRLTRYHCEGPLNKSVSLDVICNGEANCPLEDDESNCKKDVCRRHHLSLIRSNLDKIGKNQEGTSMGELLATWKTKVSSTLKVAENNDRPNPAIIREIIKEMLNDLVNTYGALEDYRRNNAYALKEFTNIAKNLQKFLRLCSY